MQLNAGTGLLASGSACRGLARGNETMNNGFLGLSTEGGAKLGVEDHYSGANVCLVSGLEGRAVMLVRPSWFDGGSPLPNVALVAGEGGGKGYVASEPSGATVSAASARPPSSSRSSGNKAR